MIELRYRDGFVFDKDESPFQFLANKLKIGFMPPLDLLYSEDLSERVAGLGIGFDLRVNKPSGTLLVKIRQGHVNGKPGLVIDTSVRSTKDDGINLSPEFILRWLDDAHFIQKHVFRTLIDSAYARTFK